MTFVDTSLGAWSTSIPVCAGCIFADFDGISVVSAYRGVAVSLVGCSFERNTLFPYDYGAAVIQADASADYSNTEVWLEGCIFSDNLPYTLPALLADNRETDTAKGRFYSDSSSPTVCTYEGPDQFSTPPPCESSSPEPLAVPGSTATRGFLTASNSWLVDVQEVLPLRCPHVVAACA